MKTKLGLLVFTLAALVAGLRATEPSPRATGKVLVLDNRRILEGDIERVGGQYRIRRSVGETWVPAGKALCLCASLEEAYAYLQGQANLRDPDERLRLARWCHLRGLREQGLAEAEAALALRPDFAEARRLVSCLQRAAVAPPPAPTAPPTEEAVPEAELALAADLSADVVGQFNTRVQPILMNACASCHATGRGGAFRLTWVYEAGLSSRRSVQQNLAAVLGQVNLDRPAASPLLVKAVNQHGTLAQAPFKDRQARAYQALEQWVQTALASNPQLRETAGTAATPEPKAVPADVPAVKAESPPPAPEPPVAEAPEVKATPAAPADEFDPAIFNRQVHGEGKH